MAVADGVEDYLEQHVVDEQNKNKFLNVNKMAIAQSKWPKMRKKARPLSFLKVLKLKKAKCPSFKEISIFDHYARDMAIL